MKRKLNMLAKISDKIINNVDKNICLCFDDIWYKVYDQDNRSCEQITNSIVESIIK